MMTKINKKPKCLFCSRLKGHAKNIAILVPKYKGKRLIYYETEHFLATAELHPVVKDPYFLIVPKHHYNAFSQIDISYAKEMDIIVRYLKELFPHKKSYVIFEHGEIFGQKKVQSIYHAHSHVILTNFNYFLHILKKMKKDKMNPHILRFYTHSTIEEIQKKVKNESYLLFRQETTGALVKIKKEMRIPSQIFRKWMHELDNPDKKFINWKKLSKKEKEVVQNRLLLLLKKSFID